MRNKEIIIELFNENVKGRKPDITGSKHHGSYGHWLEKQMGINPNSKNSADILGYEMKTHTRSKTSFGDWSPDKSLWGRYPSDQEISRLNRDEEFLLMFGKANPLKNNRYSWSGKPAPKINFYNSFGQKLIITSGKDIQVIYSYSADKRGDKKNIIPDYLKKDNLILAQWSKVKIKNKLERKFNQNGWFKCIMNQQGEFEEIVFGDPINYENWIKLIKEGHVFFDPGMYQGNKRPYAHWRANNDLWEQLIIDRYPR